MGIKGLGIGKLVFGVRPRHKARMKLERKEKNKSHFDLGLFYPSNFILHSYRNASIAFTLAA
jgi:hypothetical protein